MVHTVYGNQELKAEANHIHQFDQCGLQGFAGPGLESEELPFYYSHYWCLHEVTLRYVTVVILLAVAK